MLLVETLPSSLAPLLEEAAAPCIAAFTAVAPTFNGVLAAIEEDAHEEDEGLPPPPRAPPAPEEEEEAQVFRRLTCETGRPPVGYSSSSSSPSPSSRAAAACAGVTVGVAMAD